MATPTAARPTKNIGAAAHARRRRHQGSGHARARARRATQACAGTMTTELHVCAMLSCRPAQLREARAAPAQRRLEGARHDGQEATRHPLHRQHLDPLEIHAESAPWRSFNFCSRRAWRRSRTRPSAARRRRASRRPSTRRAPKDALARVSSATSPPQCCVRVHAASLALPTRPAADHYPDPTITTWKPVRALSLLVTPRYGVENPALRR